MKVISTLDGLYRKISVCQTATPVPIYTDIGKFLHFDVEASSVGACILYCCKPSGHRKCPGS